MKGIDISHFNGVINWDLVKTNADKISYAYFKVTQGTGFIDPKVSYNATNAKRVGLQIGYYHFASINNADDVADAKAEAAFFLNAIKTLPVADMPVVLDIEQNNLKLPPAKVLEFIKIFASIVQDAGYGFALYSGTPFLNSNLPANHGLIYDLWIAAYTGASTPVLPNGWTSYWKWQYTDKGIVTGITGGVDMDITKINYGQ